MTRDTNQVMEEDSKHVGRSRMVQCSGATLDTLYLDPYQSQAHHHMVGRETIGRRSQACALMVP